MTVTDDVEPFQKRALAWMNDPRVRLVVLLIVGVIAWILFFRNYPLEPAVPRYAEF